jgi:hypothetical protein
MIASLQSSLHLKKILRTLLSVFPEILLKVSMSEKIVCQLLLNICVYDVGSFLVCPIPHGVVLWARFNQVTNSALPILDIEVRDLHSF